MKFAVRYHSKTGNTKKVAMAVAEALGVEALEASEALDSETKVVFLCNAIYAGGLDGEIKKFIKTLDSDVMIVDVSTTAAAGSTYKLVGKLAEKQGVKLYEEEFSCWGKFLAVHKDRPNQEDLENAASFAKEVAEKLAK